jgi:hypothetical protein
MNYPYFRDNKLEKNDIKTGSIILWSSLRGCLIAKRGVSHKVLNKTNNLQKPNPPTPLPYKGMGILKPLPYKERGLERG